MKRIPFFSECISPRRGKLSFSKKRNGDISQIASANLAANAKEVALKVEGAASRCRFYYRTGHEAWRQLGGDQDGTILSTKSAGGFVGTYIGLFARSSPTPTAGETPK